MPRRGITECFAEYGAKLKNPQWSVSAWSPSGSLVVSLWDHHYRKGAPGTMQFTGKFSRWTGHGNAEFRENVARAYAAKATVQLVIARTEEIARVEAGEDGSTIKKDFGTRPELAGEVLSVEGDDYVFQFAKNA